MSRPFLWTVYAYVPGGYFHRENVATFFEHGDAASFVSANRERPHYIDAGRYDERGSGYRATPRDYGFDFRKWCAKVDAARERRVA